MQHEINQPIADSIGAAHQAVTRITNLVANVGALLSGPVPTGVGEDGPSRGLVGDAAELTKRLAALERDVESIASAVGVSAMPETEPGYGNPAKGYR